MGSASSSMDGGWLTLSADVILSEWSACRFARRTVGVGEKAIL